jgi:hypothetical protein
LTISLAVFLASFSVHNLALLLLTQVCTKFIAVKTSAAALAAKAEVVPLDESSRRDSTNHAMLQMAHSAIGIQAE